MANWYVNGQSVGNGTDPASAFPSVLSVSWTNGDRAWIRRTHSEAITSSQFIGDSVADLSSFEKEVFVIGWPNAGDPFYDARPAAGVSAGWDSEEPATQVYSNYGYKWPCFTNSNNNASGILPGIHSYLANMYVVNCGGAGAQFGMRMADDVREYSVLDHVMFSFNHGTMTGPVGTGVQAMRFEHIILVISAATSAGKIFQFDFQGETVEVHSSSQCGALFGLNQGEALPTRVRHLINWSNSIGYIFAGAQNVNPGRYDHHAHIQKCSGVQPYSGAVSSYGWNSVYNFYCDEYFGTGPRMETELKPKWRQCTSAEAMYGTSPAQKYSVNSELVDRHVMGRIGRFPSLMKSFPVTSGTPMTITLPIYVDSTAVFSPISGLSHAHFFAHGCADKVVGSVAVGSYTPWAGTLVAGGSAYIAVFSFTPQETGNAVFAFYPGKFTNATSGSTYSTYVLFGEPY